MSKSAACRRWNTEQLVDDQKLATLTLARQTFILEQHFKDPQGAK
jgi:hypothetical protein